MSFCVPQGSDVDSAASVYSETNTVTVNTLIPGSIYAFQIRARNERGYGPYSNTIYFTTLPLGTTLTAVKVHHHNYHTTELVEFTIFRVRSLNEEIIYESKTTDKYQVKSQIF